MKFFVRAKNWKEYYVLPDSVISYVTGNPSCKILTIRLPIPLWYDWEQTDYGRCWRFGQKWLNIHFCHSDDRKYIPNLWTVYASVLHPIREYIKSSYYR